jgi:transcriptional regulator with XRE-family HTH domain
MLRLEKVLKASGKKQTWLADKLGIGKSAMNNLVKGRSNPSLPKVYEIAKILECSVYDLIEPNSYASNFDNEKASNIQDIEKESELKEIKNLIKEIYKKLETKNIEDKPTGKRKSMFIQLHYIKEVITEKGFSLMDVNRRLNEYEGFINKYADKPHKLPNSQVLKRIAKALELPVKDLLTFEGEKEYYK